MQTQNENSIKKFKKKILITLIACLKAHDFFHVCTSLEYGVYASKKTRAYKQAFTCNNFYFFKLIFLCTVHVLHT